MWFVQIGVTLYLPFSPSLPSIPGRPGVPGSPGVPRRPGGPGIGKLPGQRPGGPLIPGSPTSPNHGKKTITQLFNLVTVSTLNGVHYYECNRTL